MHKVYDVAIVGGGASGILAAIELTCGSDALSGENIVILERNDRIGKKLIATGNGQGNLSNANISADNYYGDKKFIKAFLNGLGDITTENYFSNFGMPFCTEKNGKQYPLSKQASAVLDVLMSILDKKGVNVKTNAKVVKLFELNGAYQIQTEQKEEVFAKNVILSYGGSSAKQFGTDGTSYVLAESLGHKTTKLYPSLVQLKTETQNIKGLKGIKEKVRLNAFDGARFLGSNCGDLLFTDFGISGDTVFNLSAKLVDKKAPTVVIEFLPDYSIDYLASIIEKRIKSGYFASDKILDGIVNKRVAKAILALSGTKNAFAIAEMLKNFKLKITGTLGFNYSQVTKGGINTEFINPLTMKSKLNKNLYLTGELLDVDGDCGGYNLNFAFLSGILAGKEIKKSIIR